MGANLAADITRLREVKGKSGWLCVVEGLLFENGFQAVVLYRLAHWFKTHGVRFLGPLVARYTLWLTGVDIAPAAIIGPGLYISHGNGIVIGGSARLGARAFLLQQVTIGAPSPARVAEMPSLGDNVFVGAGARLIGGIRIGDDVFIGVNAVVAEDIPSGSRVTSAAGLRIEPREGR
jgi:serine O-acetyltransferase